MFLTDHLGQLLIDMDSGQHRALEINACLMQPRNTGGAAFKAFRMPGIACAYL